MASPFSIGGNSNPLTPPWIMRPSAAGAQHGSAEHYGGRDYSAGHGSMGLTPPSTRTVTPRSSLSPASRPTLSTRRRQRSPGRDADDTQERERSRERAARRSQSRPTNDDHTAPGQGWGPRIILLENKIAALELSLAQNSTEMQQKVEHMRRFVGEVESRFGQIESAVPQRCHNIEERQAGQVTLVNEMAQQIARKFDELEELIRTKLVPPVPPSFGNRPPQHFHYGSSVGSPLSAPNVAPAAPPMAATSPTLSPPTPGMPLERKPFNEKLWSAADSKVSKELKPFAGVAATYKTWANRVKDHFCKKNADWAVAFAEIEKTKTPISMDKLRTCDIVGDSATIEIDFKWISNTLWTFIGEHVNDTLYNNRSVLAGGGSNGVELWRALYMKHEGGALQVELGGIGNLHSFPQCDKIDDLQFWIGKWEEQRNMYGAGISDVHLRSMYQCL